MKKIRRNVHAKERLTVPVKIKLKTRDGRNVTFKARRNVTKPVKIKFKFIRKFNKKIK